MAFDIHTLDVMSGQPGTPYLNRQDRVQFANFSIANLAGSGAGAAVTVAVAMQLPASYAVQVQPGQDASVYVDPASKTTSGFNIILHPRLAANTLAAGTLDVTILA